MAPKVYGTLSEKDLRKEMALLKKAGIIPVITNFKEFINFLNTPKNENKPNSLPID